MSFHQGYRSQRRRSRTGKWRFIPAVCLVIVLFYGGVRWFRHEANQKTEAAVEKTAVDPVAQLLNSEHPLAPAFRAREEFLMQRANGDGQTVATRQVEDHLFHHTIVSHLPDPPEGYYYAGWLLRKIPYDFFSTGRFDRNADGTYALIWNGEQGRDYQDYNQVVITLERDGGDPGPSGHVLEGQFGS